MRAATASGTATSGADFDAKNAIVTFPAGTTEVLFTVTLRNDAIDEGFETYSLVLSEPVGATIATPVVSSTIQDNDDPAAGVISFAADVTVTEGHAGATLMRFIITLNSASTSPVTVPYATADASAVASSDYTPVFGVLTFAPGETSKTIDVLVHGDDEFERDETFRFLVGSEASATGRIVNDDDAPVRRRPTR